MEERRDIRRKRGRRNAKRESGGNNAPHPKTIHYRRQRQDEVISRLGRDGRHQNTIVVPHDQYHVGWICALSDELAAASGMLDEIYERHYQPRSDTNTYILGTIAEHRVVMACLPTQGYGTSNAAVVATNMRRTFPSICFWLLVGIGGGAPGKVDIRLGDVVVSTKVIQIDLGKIVRDGQLHRTSVVRTPSQSLMTAIAALQARHRKSSSKISGFIYQMLKRDPGMEGFSDPGADSDLLFDSNHEHTPQLMDNCSLCNMSRLLRRNTRINRDPIVHYGTIASANQVMRDPKTRDRLMNELDILCFEMEAAGLMESCSSIVIRGIADYADSHKNNRWQCYAAATAAAYAKELLSVIPLAEKSGTEVQRGMQRTHRVTARHSHNTPSVSRGTEQVHRIKGVKAGDDANQMFLSNGTPLRIEKATVRNRGFQLFGDIPLQDALKIIDRKHSTGTEEAAEEVTASSAGGSAAI